MGREAVGNLSARGLSRTVSAIAGPYGASRSEIRSRPLGCGAVGARRGNADVRVRPQHERYPARSLTRSASRGQDSSLTIAQSILSMDIESQMIVRPARNVSGSLSLPGDKSISHRYAMLPASADGPSRLENYSTGADCASTLGCLRALRGKWEAQTGGGDAIEVQGSGLSLSTPRQPLDCGNSGSTIRMLSGIVAGQKFATEMAGDESL